MLKPTPIHIVERNRRNALQSTGPKTALGKQASRGNALKHGLCANPAVGVVEDEQAFIDLHEALIDRFQPHDPLEQGLIHRIAVSLWRLQRAAHIESAAGVLQSTAISSASDRVQQWVTEITQKFTAIDWVEITDKELLRQRAIQKPETEGQRWLRVERRFLLHADRYRDEVLMADGTAIQAMILIIGELTDQLKYIRRIDSTQAQMLAWLMGESAGRLVEPVDAEQRDASYYPDEQRNPTPIDSLIGEARLRAEGDPLSPALTAAIQSCLTDLQIKSRCTSAPYTEEHEAHIRTNTLLPDASLLDRLIRYEGHAERSLFKAIETLSKLRGVTVESVRATMTRPSNGDESLEVSGERTTWSST
ncbi:MAG: hypothetical protein AAGB26_15040 [Planctomycetota bacterium]